MGRRMKQEEIRAGQDYNFYEEEEQEVTPTEEDKRSWDQFFCRPCYSFCPSSSFIFDESAMIALFSLESLSVFPGTFLRQRRRCYEERFPGKDFASLTLIF